MKKQFVLGFVVLAAASQAFASGSPVVNCQVPGQKNRNVYIELSERDNNTDTSYVTDVSGAQIQDDKGSLQNEITPADQKANLGYYLNKSKKEGNTTNVVLEKLKVRIKSNEGSVIAIDGQGNGGKNGMESTLTVVLRGKDANGADMKDLRNVKTTCSYDYE